MAEDPVTIVKGGTLAQNIIGTAPEGMLIARPGSASSPSCST